VAILREQFARFLSSLKPEQKDASVGPTGLCIPLYVYPAGDGVECYDRITSAKLAHPSLPMIVTLNPSSGPGTQKDGNYERAIARLRGAGITVIGYVFTSWGGRGAADVAEDIRKYRTWYGLEGIMLDEFSTSAVLGSYYRAIGQFARSLGMTFVMGNPGTDIPEQLVGLADNFIIYENAGLPGRDRLGGWHESYGRQKWSCCSHSAQFDEKRLRAASKYLGYVYMTDDTLPNPYDSISSYFEEMVAALDSCNREGMIAAMWKQ
jgi:hypothetical protein